MVMLCSVWGHIEGRFGIIAGSFWHRFEIVQGVFLHLFFEDFVVYVEKR